LSIPAAPRLRFTLLNASYISLGVILPVSEWTFCVLTDLSNLFTYARCQITEVFCRASRRKCFLARVGLPTRGANERFSRRSLRTNCLRDPHFIKPLSNGSPFRKFSATPGELPSLRRGIIGILLRHRINQTFSAVPYRLALLTRTSGKTEWDFHRSIPSAILLRRGHQTHAQAPGSTRISPERRSNLYLLLLGAS
jgi:hypothetical protein